THESSRYPHKPARGRISAARRVCPSAGPVRRDRHPVARRTPAGHVVVLPRSSAAEWMRFEWKPTLDDLGVAPPLGAQPTDQATLSGIVLAPAIHPALATLGNATLTVV